MKLIELDPPTTARRRPGRALPRQAARADLVPGFGGESIRVRRLPRGGGASGAEPASGPAIANPSAVAIAIEEARRARIMVGAALLLVMIALLWVLLAPGTSGTSSRPHKVPVRLTAAQQRAAAAARARAAAIAQAKRDRGTDAALQDTIPPATAPTTGAYTTTSAAIP